MRIGQLHSPAVLYPGKVPPVPPTRNLGGVQSLSGQFGEQKKSLVSNGNRTMFPRMSSPQQTLSRLSYPILVPLTFQS
jgi:hypothetical protein